MLGGKNNNNNNNQNNQNRNSGGNNSINNNNNNNSNNNNSNADLAGAQFTQSMFMHRAGELENSLDSSVIGNPIMRDSMVTASMVINPRESVYYDAQETWEPSNSRLTPPNNNNTSLSEQDQGGAFVL